MPTVGPRVLWITPLRALAIDTRENLKRPVEALGLPWAVQERTGDTPQSTRQKQRKRLPTCLVTTPESLSVLLSYANAEEAFRGLEAVVVDEWHELLSTKRGTQTELGLARLRTFNPGLQTWGLSATLGNLDEAQDCLLGVDPATGGARPGARIPGPRGRGLRTRNALARGRPPLPVVRPPGHRPARRRARRAGGRRLHAAVHEHPGAGGDLVRPHLRGPARVARRGRPAPRQHRPRHPQERRADAPLRRVAGLRLHQFAGPGRGLLPRRAGDPGRQPEGRRPHAAAGRPQRAPPRREVPDRRGADQRPGGAGLRRRPRRREPEGDREPRPAGPPAGRRGAAPGDRRRRRRLRQGRDARGAQDDLVVPEPHRRGVRLVPGLRGPRRREPPGLPPLRAGGGGPGEAGLLRRRRAEDRPGPPDGHRHDHQQRDDPGADGQPLAGHRRGDLRRVPEAQRPLRVRRPTCCSW